MSMELDALDRLAASAFDGYLVRKDLVRKYSRQYPVPTYVVEFLLGRYCASVDENEIDEGLQIVEKQLKDRTVRTGEEELFKARAKETGSVKLIDIVHARLDAKNDCYLAELPSLALRDVRIDDQTGPRQRAHADRRLLRRGDAELRRRSSPRRQEAGRSRSDALRPIQMSKSDVLDVLTKARQTFSVAEWIDFLLRSIGLEAVGALRSRQEGRPPADDAVRRAELQPGRARPARNGQEPPVPADLAVLAPDFRRQGDGGEDVRQQRRPGSAAWSASTTWSASTRYRASRSIRRTASTS